MNLISFPAWTCGGLFCDILNKTLSPLDNNGGMGLPYHKGLLIVHGPDTDNNELLQEKINAVDLSQDIWVGTHTYPNKIDLNQFNNVIIVNLTTPKSILYRYARVFYQCLYGNGINGDRTLSKPDLWKMINNPVLEGNNVHNIEFEDIVHWSESMNQLLNKFVVSSDRAFVDNRKKVWMNLNSFLYDIEFIQKCSDKLLFRL